MEWLSPLMRWSTSDASVRHPGYPSWQTQLSLTSTALLMLGQFLGNRDRRLLLFQLNVSPREGAPKRSRPLGGAACGAAPTRRETGLLPVDLLD